MKKKYTHIFFDLDNTLWDFNRNSYFAMQSTFENYPVQCQGINFSTFFEVYSKHNHLLWSAYRKNKVSKKELIGKRFQQTFDELQIQGIDPVQMNFLYLQEMPKQNHLNDGVLEILYYLKSKRYRLYIITNGFKEVQHKKLESSGLSPFFEKIFTSEEIKTSKPDRGIFEYAIKSANAKKKSSLMVGDDWDVDVLGALNFGIDAVHFDNNDTHNIELFGNLIVGKNKVCKIVSIHLLQTIL